MANIERLRNVDQQITSTVDEITNNFKQRIQSILSENQLLLSNHKLFNLRPRIIFYPFSTSTSYISTINSL
jgi:regulator of replication initiation timing